MNNFIVNTEIKGIDKEQFLVDAIISSSKNDRDKERIIPLAFEKNIKTYKKHPVLLSSHTFHGLQNQIGEAVSNSIRINEKNVEMTFCYYVGKGNPEADWGFFLASKKRAAYSVSFIPIAWENKDIEKDGIYREYTEIELVEVSHVTVPSNRESLQRMKNMGIVEDDLYKELSELIDEFQKTFKETSKKNYKNYYKELLAISVLKRQQPQFNSDDLALMKNFKI